MRQQGYSVVNFPTFVLERSPISIVERMHGGPHEMLRVGAVRCGMLRPCCRRLEDGSDPCHRYRLHRGTCPCFWPRFIRVSRSSIIPAVTDLFSTREGCRESNSIQDGKGTMASYSRGTVRQQRHVAPGGSRTAAGENRPGYTPSIRPPPSPIHALDNAPSTGY